MFWRYISISFKPLTAATTYTTNFRYYPSTYGRRSQQEIMFPSAPFFTPPSSKANAQTKACMCHWGDECSKFKTLFDNNDSELGKLFSASTTFTTLPSVSSVQCIPNHTQAELKGRYKRYLKDPTNVPCPRIKIAKFHFPIFLHTLANGMPPCQWRKCKSLVVV